MGRQHRVLWFVLGLVLVIACSTRDDATLVASSTQQLKVLDASLSKIPPNIKKKTKKKPDGFVRVLSVNNQTGLIVAAGDASPWIVGEDDHIYHYNNDYPAAPLPAQARSFLEQSNSPQSSTDTYSLAVSPEGTPWKIDSTTHHVWKNTGPRPFESTGMWTQMGTQTFYEVGVGKNDQAFAIATGCVPNCPVFQWAAGNWVPTNQVGRHVAVAPDGTAYVSDQAGMIYWLPVGAPNFTLFPSAQTTVNSGTPGQPVLGAGPNNALWAIGITNGSGGYDVESFSSFSNDWTAVPNIFAEKVSVSADGTPWVIDDRHYIYEYVTAWEQVGPFGFSFDANGVTQVQSGLVTDIDVNADGWVTLATQGGVYALPPPVGSWSPIEIVGQVAGVTDACGDQNGTLQQLPYAGPIGSIGTIATKTGPNHDSNYLVVGTGIGQGGNGVQPLGNGVWYTPLAHGAWCLPNLPWYQSVFNGGTTPTSFVRIRYSADGTTLYALSPNNLWWSTDDGQSFNLSCAVTQADRFTDLVIDPRDASVAYIGVIHEGVQQVRGTGTICSPGSPPPLALEGDPSTITNVALAITSTLETSVLYAAFAGTGTLNGDTVDDFKNIDAVSAGTWPAPWNVVVDANAYVGAGWGLSAGGLHSWSLGTDPSGSNIILGAKGLWHASSCSVNGCPFFQEDGRQTQLSQWHADHHVVTWDPLSSTTVYVGNDGGIFSTTSLTEAILWSSLNDGLPTTLQSSVDVNGANIFTTAWDNGAILNTGSGWKQVTGADGSQAVADRSPNSPYGYFSTSTDGCPGGFSCTRSRWDGTNLNGIDTPPLAVAAEPARMAKGLAGDLFTTNAQNPIAILNSNNQGASWSQYQASLPFVYSVVVSNENPPTVYAVEDGRHFLASVGGGPWNPEINMVQPAGPWPNNNAYRFAFEGSLVGAPAMTTDYASNDLYTLGLSDYFPYNPVVAKSAVGSYGTTWSLLTGIVAPSTGIPGMLKQDDHAGTLFVDASSHAVIVGTDGLRPLLTSPIYGPATLWRLNNPDVDDAYHHWRPWVQGSTTLPITWLSGQWEAPVGAGGGKVFYIYAAVNGGGIWKREARGGDL